MKKNAFAKTIRLIVRAPQLRDGEHLAIVGSDPALGAWETARAIPMVQQDYNEWATDINVEALAVNYLEYKFVAINDKKDASTWETG